MLSAEEAQARREAEEEALALGLPQAKAAASTANFTNDAALRLKLENVERPLAASDECLSFRSAHIKATGAQSPV